MSEPPIRDANLAEDAQPLAYRTHEEWGGLPKAYRVVGLFLLLYAGVNLLGTIAQVLVLGPAMNSVSSLTSQAAMLSTSLPLAIGGLGMIATRSWGAKLAFVAEGLMAFTMLVLAIAQISAAPTTAKALTTLAFAKGTVLHIVIAFLPFAIWRLCRGRGVFEVGAG